MENNPFLRETYIEIYKILDPKDILNFRLTSKIAKEKSPPLEEIRIRRQKEIDIDDKYQKWIKNRDDIYNYYWYFHDFIITKYENFKRIDITKELNLVTFRDYKNLHLSFKILVKNINFINYYPNSQRNSYIVNYLLSNRKYYSIYHNCIDNLKLESIPKEYNSLESFFKNPPKQYKYTQILSPILEFFNRMIYEYISYKEYSNISLGLSENDLHNFYVIEIYFVIPHNGTPTERLNRICTKISDHTDQL
jgi:hypothetical protein